MVLAAQASFRLNRYREAIEWCDKGLRVDPAHSVLIELSAKAEGNRVGSVMALFL